MERVSRICRKNTPHLNIEFPESHFPDTTGAQVTVIYQRGQLDRRNPSPLKEGAAIIKFKEVLPQSLK